MSKRLEGYDAIRVRRAALVSAKGKPVACYWCRCKLKKKPFRQGEPIPADYPTVDHVINVANGGTDDPTNLEWACFKCNSERGARAMHMRTLK